MSSHLRLVLLAFAAAVAGCQLQPNARIAEDKPAAIHGLHGQLDRSFMRSERKGFSGAVTVIAAGEPVIAKGYGIANRNTGQPATRSTLFHLASVSKTFTGAAIVALQEDGKLRVSDPITRYLDNVPADKRAITIHHLLTHTSGLPHRVGECSSEVAYMHRETYVAHVLQARLNSPPGKTYDYSNDGYGLLGVIIERASGLSYEQFLRERFFVPLGMSRTGYSFDERILGDAAPAYDGNKSYLVNLNPTFRNESGPAWCNRASGGLLSTAEDMQRWLLALRNNLVLSEASTALMLHPHVAESAARTSFYGYGWALLTMRRGTRVAAHNGSIGGYYTADLRWYLDEDFAFFVAANRKELDAERKSAAIAKILLRQMR